MAKQDELGEFDASFIFNPTVDFDSGPRVNEDGLFDDAIDSAQRGAYQAGAGIFDFFGLNGVSDWLTERADSQLDEMSQLHRDALNKSFVTRDADGKLIAGDALGDFRSWVLNLANVAGQFAPSLAGVGALNWLSKAGKLGKLSSARGLSDRGRMLAYGGIGGSAATGQAEKQVRDLADNMSWDTLIQSDKFRELMAQGDRTLPAEQQFLAAKEKLKDQLETDVKTDIQMLLFNFAGSAIGDSVIGKALGGAIARTLPRAIVKAGGIEAGTEFAQESSQQLAVNEAVNPIDGTPLGEGVIEGGLTGALLGGGLGGIVGGLRAPKKLFLDKDEIEFDAAGKNNTGLADVDGALDSVDNVSVPALNPDIDFDQPAIKRNFESPGPTNEGPSGPTTGDVDLDVPTAARNFGMNNAQSGILGNRLLDPEFQREQESLRPEFEPFVDKFKGIEPEPQEDAPLQDPADPEQEIHLRVHGQPFARPGDVKGSNAYKQAQRQAGKMGLTVEVVPFRAGFGWRYVPKKKEVAKPPGNNPGPGLNLDNDRDNSTTQKPQNGPARSSRTGPGTETEQTNLGRRGERGSNRTTSDQFNDIVNIEWEQVETSTVQVGTTKANTPEEAAHIFAPFRKEAQENFYALVTDINGEVLNYIHNSKGAKGQSQVYSDELVSAIVATPGAKNVWFGHHHPSGSIKPSKEDFGLTTALVDLLDATGILFKGHIIVAPGSKKATYFKTSRRSYPVAIKTLRRDQTLGLTTRKLRRLDKSKLEKAEYGEDVIKQAERIQNEDAIMLYDSQLQLTGVIQLNAQEMSHLRLNKRVNRIFKMMDTTNSARFVIKTDDLGAARNVARFINRFAKPDIMDWVHRDKDGNYIRDSIEFKRLYAKEIKGTKITNQLNLQHGPFLSRTDPEPNDPADFGRRDFLKVSAAAVTVAAGLGGTKAYLGGFSDPKVGTAKPISEKILTADVPESVANIAKTKNNLRSVIKEIARVGPPELRGLANTLVELLPENVHVKVDDTSLPNANGSTWVDESKRNGLVTLYTAKLNSGKNRSGLTYSTILHEALHAAVLARFFTINYGSFPLNFRKIKGKAPKSSPEIEQFIELYNEFNKEHQSRTSGKNRKEIQETLGISLAEALYTPDEFFVRALTDAKFQKYLASLRYKGDKLDKPGHSMWDRFKHWVKTVLFNIEGDAPSWLDAALMSSNELLGGLKKDSPDFINAKAFLDWDTKANRILSATEPERTPDEKLGLVPKVPKQKTLVSYVTDLFTQKNRERFVEGTSDGIVGLLDAEKRKLGDEWSVDRSGYISARLATSAATVMNGIMRFAAPIWDNDNGNLPGNGAITEKADTQGLLTTFAELGPDLNDWLGWMAANRAKGLMAEGKESNLTVDDIKELIDRAEGKETKFKRAKEEYNKTHSAILDLIQAAGLVSAKTRKGWDESWYVPFDRDMSLDENLEFRDYTRVPYTKEGIANQSAMVKKLIGRNIPTNDLLQNILGREMKFVDAAMKNNAMIEVADILTEGGDKTYMELVKLSPSVRKQLNAVKSPYIFVMRDGKRQYYKVHDQPLLRGLLQIGLPRGFESLPYKWARKFKKWLTLGIVSSFDFLANNAIRDAVHSWAINKGDFTLGVDSVKGMNSALKEDKWYRELVFAAGSFNGGNVHGGEPDANVELIRRSLAKQGLSRSEQDKYLGSIKGWDWLQTKWQQYREFGDKVENAARIGTFIDARKGGKSIKEAAFDAKDLLDFSMRGNFHTVGAMADIIPFWNARVQGLSKIYRAGKASGNDRFLKVFSAQVAAAGAKIAAVSILLAMRNKDDERYEALPDWDRDANWHIFQGDQHFRIPKPFELGIIFGTMPERLFLASEGKQDGADLRKAALHGITSTLNLVQLPTILRPLAEAGFNYDWFKQRPIDSLGDLGVEPRARAGRHTSDLAKLLGDQINMSPKRIEHMIRGYMGTLGAYALSGADIIVRGLVDAPAKPTRRPRDYWLLRSLYRNENNPPTSTSFGDKFYELLLASQEAQSTYNRHKGNRLFEKARDFREEHLEEILDLPGMARVQRQVSAINKQLRLANLSRSMSGPRKRERVNSLQRRKNALLKRAAERFDR